MYISLLTGISVASVADSVAIAYLISLRDRAFQVPRWLAYFFRYICRYKAGQQKMYKPAELFSNCQNSKVVVKSIPEKLEPQDAPNPVFLDEQRDKFVVTKSARKRNQSRSLTPKLSRQRTKSEESDKVNPLVKPDDKYLLHYAAHNCNHFRTNTGSVSSSTNYDMSETSRRGSPMRIRKQMRSASSLQPLPASRSSLVKQKPNPPMFELRYGYEVVFVRWYKVARIINAVGFFLSFCFQIILLLLFLYFFSFRPYSSFA